MSAVALAISTLPLAVSAALALAGICIASQTPVAMPPADQFVAIAHRTRLRIATGPAELFRALPIAFAQLFAAIASILDLVLGRVVDQPQLERIDVRRVGELIHRAFDGIGAFRSARRTHVARGILIELDKPLTELAVCAFVEQARPVDQIPLE